jgi:transposase
MAELCAKPQAHDANRRLLAHLAKESNALFTYLLIDGVDATNWKGETGVRPCVVNRKTWGGNRTWRGAKTKASSPASSPPPPRTVSTLSPI